MFSMDETYEMNVQRTKCKCMCKCMFKVRIAKSNTYLRTVKFIFIQITLHF